MYRIYPPFITGRGAVGLLLLRIAVGAAFVFHGWYKIQSAGGPTGWMGADASVPGGLQAVAAFTEFCGGIALSLGLLTPLAALGIACTMVVAFAIQHIPHRDPFVAPGKSSFELAANYLAAALLFILIGPGILSLDGLYFGRRLAKTAPQQWR
jgi:putative oxidoreductase